MGPDAGVVDGTLPARLCKRSANSTVFPHNPSGSSALARQIGLRIERRVCATARSCYDEIAGRMRILLDVPRARRHPEPRRLPHLTEAANEVLRATAQARMKYAGLLRQHTRVVLAALNDRLMPESLTADGES